MNNMKDMRGIFTEAGKDGSVRALDCIELADTLIPVEVFEDCGAMDGDFVEFNVEKGLAQITKVVSRASGCLAGVIREHNGSYYVNGGNFSVRVGDALPSGSHLGDLACAAIGEDGNFKIKKVFGAPTDAEANLSALLMATGLDKGFDVDVRVQAKELAFTEISSRMATRTDLRSKTVITISESENSRTECGFSVERDKDGNYVLGLHTVDAAEFIPRGSALERAVFSRGKTAILPDREIPMLPEALSKGPCFLEVGADRLAVSYMLTINEDGKVIAFDFCESIIKTAANCLFDEIDALIFETEASAIIPLRQAYASIMPTIDNMFNLGGILQAARVQGGGADIDEAERHFVYARHGNLPIGLVSRKESDPKRLVREFLAVAGMELASYLNRNNIPTIYRVQNAPEAEDVVELRDKAAILGINTEGVEDSAVLAYIAERSHGLRAEELLLFGLHSILPKAEFASVPKRHSVHGSDMYVRFAYPINRCADFCMQRIVKAIIHARDTGESLDKAALAKIAANGIACASVFETRVGKAENLAEDILSYECLARIAAKDYKGYVSLVTETEAVLLLDNGCIAHLPVGEGESYSYGDQLDVSFDSVDYVHNKLYVRI